EAGAERVRVPELPAIAIGGRGIPFLVYGVVVVRRARNAKRVRRDERSRRLPTGRCAVRAGRKSRLVSVDRSVDLWRELALRVLARKVVTERAEIVAFQRDATAVSMIVVGLERRVAREHEPAVAARCQARVRNVTVAVFIEPGHTDTHAIGERQGDTGVRTHVVVVEAVAGGEVGAEVV